MDFEEVDTFGFQLRTGASVRREMDNDGRLEGSSGGVPFGVRAVAKDLWAGLIA